MGRAVGGMVDVEEPGFSTCLTPFPSSAHLLLSSLAVLFSGRRGRTQFVYLSSLIFSFLFPPPPTLLYCHFLRLTWRSPAFLPSYPIPFLCPPPPILLGCPLPRSTWKYPVCLLVQLHFPLFTLLLPSSSAVLFSGALIIAR